MPITGDSLAQTLRDFVKGIAPSAVPFSKPELKAAIAAADAWMESNAASYNAALPQPFRGTATVSWKAIILALVALRRSGK